MKFLPSGFKSYHLNRQTDRQTDSQTFITYRADGFVQQFTFNNFSRFMGEGYLTAFLCLKTGVWTNLIRIKRDSSSTVKAIVLNAAGTGAESFTRWQYLTITLQSYFC